MQKQFVWKYSENIVVKGEIVHNEQFLQLPSLLTTLFNDNIFI